MQDYFDIAFSADVRRLQENKGSRRLYDGADTRPGNPHKIGHEEISFITARDSFYIATISSTGWPYVQHRGGDIGFVKVLGPTTIGWLERPGNRQYIGTGNITADDRVSMILVDYPERARLKLFGHARHMPQPDEGLLKQLGGDFRSDGAVTVDIAAYNWNCPKHITPRFTSEQLEARASTARQWTR